MYCFEKKKPQKEFCTIVAKKLVNKHCFMKDIGEKVSGYVSVVCYSIECVGFCMCMCMQPVCG